jgi:site-specific DNA recombinase
MANAVLYLRISQDEQGTGLAVERQREDCLKIIRAREWDLVGEYVDNAVSASKRRVSRPSYDRMVADYAAGKFNALVCYDLDRLTRQPRQLEDWIDAAEERGLVLVTASGEADLSTERKGARQRRANEQRAEQGRPTPGRRRYGYETDGVTPRPAEAAIVRRMFEDFAATGSIRPISQWLQAEGVSPAPGKQWDPRRVRYILNSPFYAGHAVHKGVEAPAPGVVPIVSEELSASVRAILADDARRTSPGPKAKHLASGIAVCGAPGCGRGLRRIGRTYACPVATAGHVSILATTLDARLLDEVSTAILVGGPDLFADSGDRKETARLLAQLESNDAKASATSRDRDEGLLSPAAARARLIELRSERVATEAALDRVRIQSAVSATLAESASALLVGDVMTMLEWSAAKRVVTERLRELPAERQREVVRALLAVWVESGRDARKRVHVEHLLVPSLNPGADNAERDWLS